MCIEPRALAQSARPQNLADATIEARSGEINRHPMAQRSTRIFERRPDRAGQVLPYP